MVDSLLKSRNSKNNDSKCKQIYYRFGAFICVDLCRRFGCRNARRRHLPAHSRGIPVPHRMGDVWPRIVIAFSRPRVYELSRESFDPYFRRSRPPARRRFRQSAYRAEVQDVGDGNESAGRAACYWAQAILPYRRASAARGVFELVVTFPPFVAILWTAMMIAASHGQYLLSFALAPIAAGLLIRLFLIQHDCGHGSFFPKQACRRVVRMLVVCVTRPTMTGGVSMNPPTRTLVVAVRANCWISGAHVRAIPVRVPPGWRGRRAPPPSPGDVWAGRPRVPVVLFAVSGLPCERCTLSAHTQQDAGIPALLLCPILCVGFTRGCHCPSATAAAATMVCGCSSRGPASI